jgi:hypothetical protein
MDTEDRCGFPIACPPALRKANWNENFRPLACGVRSGSERGLYRKNQPSCWQLLDTVGRTKSVSVEFQGIDIAQDFEWRTVESQIVRCETGNRLQTLDVPQRIVARFTDS